MEPLSTTISALVQALAGIQEPAMEDHSCDEVVNNSLLDHHRVGGIDDDLPAGRLVLNLVGTFGICPGCLEPGQDLAG